MEITTLFFDLDGTLYPKNNGIWEAVADRIDSFMHDHLKISSEEIPAMRTSFYTNHGTTLAGLLEKYTFDPQDYLAHIHNIPLEEYIEADKDLQVVLKSIQQPKWIFTNADEKHAKRVMGLLGIADYFVGIIDIVRLNIINKPKPDAYIKALEFAHSPNPGSCIFLDDVPHNLEPATDMGIITVLVGEEKQSPAARFSIRTVHEIADVMATVIR